MSNDLAVAERLSPKERAAYEVYLANGNRNISPVTQAQFLALFLRGKSCDEICALNPSWPLGAIVKCRIEGDWDQRLADYREQLFTGVREKLQQIELESINFLTDMLAVAHKQQGDKLKRYLQTGNEDDLGEMKISSIAGYSKVLETVIKVTGQDREQTVTHQHSIKTDAVADYSALASASSDQAAEVLAKLIEVKKS
jgi:hypothetical protein